MEALKKMIGKAFNALRKEIRTRKGEQNAMMDSTWNKCNLEDIIQKASNYSFQIKITNDDASKNNNLLPNDDSPNTTSMPFLEKMDDDESNDKIQVMNRQSLWIQQKMKGLVRLHRHQLFLLLRKTSKDSALNDMQDKENMMEEHSMEYGLSYLSESEIQTFDDKDILKQLLSQRSVQNRQIAFLRKDLLLLTKTSKDNGQRKKKLFDELRSQLRECVSRARKKGIVISALEYEIKQATAPQPFF